MVKLFTKKNLEIEMISITIAYKLCIIATFMCSVLNIDSRTIDDRDRVRSVVSSPQIETNIIAAQCCRLSYDNSINQNASFLVSLG